MNTSNIASPLILVRREEAALRPFCLDEPLINSKRVNADKALRAERDGQPRVLYERRSPLDNRTI
jgi:hypothetical protein